MLLRHALTGATATAVLLASCHFSDLTPGVGHHDETSLQALPAAFYQALALRSDTALDRVALPAATALLTTDRDPAVLVPLRTMIEIPERRNQNGGARIVRVELRPDGEVATARLVVAARSSDGAHEYEATDFVTMAHRQGGWRVAHAAFGPWKPRSAP
ncbi:MAG TPA: hypothetical protein VHW65_09360 [Gemmatimonadales bacterium]|jgi:hypothetical protein|nr:hypothetical protein [Gemmatimonadales bacterium]